MEFIADQATGQTRCVIDGVTSSLAGAAEHYVGGLNAALGRTLQDWAEFLTGPWCLSLAALSFRQAWQTYSAAAESAATAAIVDLAEHVHRVCPDAASITSASFRNDDGNDVLRPRGVLDRVGRRLAAIDDDDITYADRWPTGGNEAEAEHLAYDQVDPILAGLVELDHTYRVDEIHTITVPATGRDR